MRRRIVLNFRNSEDQASENIDTTPLRRSTIAFPRLRLLYKDFKSVSHVFHIFFLFLFGLFEKCNKHTNNLVIFDADNILISIASIKFPLEVNFHRIVIRNISRNVDKRWTFLGFRRALHFSKQGTCRIETPTLPQRTPTWFPSFSYLKSNWILCFLLDMSGIHDNYRVSYSSIDFLRSFLLRKTIRISRKNTFWIFV